MSLEASFTKTPIVQLNFNPANNYPAWQNIAEILRNNHLRHIIDTRFPNVVGNEAELKEVLVQVFSGDVEPFRPLSEKFQRFANPLEVSSYKQVMFERLKAILFHPGEG